MKPRIEKSQEIKLIGNKIQMSFANNQTMQLWQSFMPRIKEIKDPAGTELYSLEVHENSEFFKNFDSSKEFQKWAAVKVNNFENVPTGMHTLTIPGGEYAVFQYKGKPSEAMATYQYIYAKWIPGSEYELDERPHFAVMGAKYKGEHPESEEEIWIPIRKK